MLPDTPQNGGYLVAAYVIATVILVGYWVALWGRAKKSVTRKETREREEKGVSGRGKA
jgi:hypothetical protein